MMRNVANCLFELVRCWKKRDHSVVSEHLLIYLLAESPKHQSISFPSTSWQKSLWKACHRTPCGIASVTSMAPGTIMASETAMTTVIRPNNRGFDRGFGMQDATRRVGLSLGEGQCRKGVTGVSTCA